MFASLLSPLAFIGRRAEALAEIAKVEQLDYGFSAGHTESATYYELQDTLILIESSRRGLLWTRTIGSSTSTSVLVTKVQQVGEAISEYEKAIEISGNSRSTVALAHACSAVGKKAEADRILRDLERKSTGGSPK